jgi:hypothetical protein
VQSNDDERLRYRIRSGKVTIVGALAKRLWELKDASEDSIYVMEDRAIKAKHPIHAATIAKYLQGKGAKHPPEKTIRGLVAAFDNKITAKEIRDLLGMPSGEDGMWQPPEESARLSRDERDVLDRLIKVIARSHEIVTSALSDVVADESGHNLPDRVAEAEEVGEDGASPEEAGGMGPRTKRKKGTPQDAPPRSRRRDKPVRPSS